MVGNFARQIPPSTLKSKVLINGWRMRTSPDTEFVTVNATTATVTVDFAYCAARYRVGATWSSWTGVVDATVIPPPAPSLVSLGTVAGNTTWQAVAPVAVDGWQFCTTDSAFDPEVKSFDRWVDDADSPDTEFVNRKRHNCHCLRGAGLLRGPVSCRGNLVELDGCC